MAPQIIEHHRRLIEYLEKHGAKEVKLIKKGRRHPFIEFTYHGVPSRYYTSLSPSDRRATVKAISDLRRILRHGTEH